MISPDKRIADLQAQLDVQRKATAVYQVALTQARDNLIMLGRGDIANSIANATLKAIQSIPQPKGTDDDDDLAG